MSQRLLGQCANECHISWNEKCNMTVNNILQLATHFQKGLSGSEKSTLALWSKRGGDKHISPAQRWGQTRFITAWRKWPKQIENGKWGYSPADIHTMNPPMCTPCKLSLISYKAWVCVWDKTWSRQRRKHEKGLCYPCCVFIHGQTC